MQYYRLPFYIVFSNVKSSLLVPSIPSFIFIFNFPFLFVLAKIIIVSTLTLPLFFLTTCLLLNDVVTYELNWNDILSMELCTLLLQYSRQQASPDGSKRQQQTN